MDGAPYGHGRRPVRERPRVWRSKADAQYGLMFFLIRGNVLRSTGKHSSQYRGGGWEYPTKSLHRFFKVKVEMP